MVTDTKSISKTGDVIIITMTDDSVFKVDVSVNPPTYHTVDGTELALTPAQQTTADQVCQAMSRINK